jgi:hypothetical protein
MFMAVWVLGPHGDYVFCRSKKGVRLATKKHLLLSGVYAGVNFDISPFSL